MAFIGTFSGWLASHVRAAWGLDRQNQNGLCSRKEEERVAVLVQIGDKDEELVKEDLLLMIVLVDLVEEDLLLVLVFDDIIEEEILLVYYLYLSPTRQDRRVQAR